MNDDAFLKLQRKWYERLRKEGFEDIETLLPNGQMGQLLKNKGNITRVQSDYASIQYDYFALARRFGQHSKLSQQERSTWNLYANGMTIRKIGKELGKSASSVYRLIKKLKKKFEQWEDTECQMDSKPR